jgi:hypothetical protein
MTFNEWFTSRYPERGGKMDFCREHAIAPATLAKALHGLPLERKKAIELSEATGGAVSRGSLCFPEEKPLASKRKTKAA